MARLPRGLTRTLTGWRITVSRGKGNAPFQRRFPATMLQDDVEDELRKERKRLNAGRASTPVGTLSADVKRYLTDHYTGRGGLAERRRHLELWMRELGADTWRHRISRDDVARVLNRWRAAGLAADTCNKRRTALLALFHALDGRGGQNPVREIPKYRAPEPLPRGLGYDLIRKALKSMALCKTRMRLAVMAYTGMRAGQLMALLPEHWDTHANVLTIPGTAKGRGTKPYTIPLSTQAQQAMKDFDRYDAWGTFTTAPMARMWRAGALAANLPPGTVPYDLRHSFGTAIYRSTGDLKVTKELMGHSAIRMTERYTLAAVPERQKSAILSFEAAVGGGKLSGKLRGTSRATAVDVPVSSRRKKA